MDPKLKNSSDGSSGLKEATPEIAHLYEAIVYIIKEEITKEEYIYLINVLGNIGITVIFRILRARKYHTVYNPETKTKATL
jgi:hypothetical protein